MTDGRMIIIFSKCLSILTMTDDCYIIIHMYLIWKTTVWLLYFRSFFILWQLLRYSYFTHKYIPIYPDRWQYDSYFFLICVNDNITVILLMRSYLPWGWQYDSYVIKILQTITMTVISLIYAHMYHDIDSIIVIFWKFL